MGGKLNGTTTFFLLFCEKLRFSQMLKFPLEKRESTSFFLGAGQKFPPGRFFYTRFWGTCVLGNLNPVVSSFLWSLDFSVHPTINPLACGCLSCLRCVRDSHLFRGKHRIANIGLAKHRFSGVLKGFILKVDI